MEKIKAGLEIHQQLDTSKLFCPCPSILRNDEPEKIIKRKLNPVVGETGKIDRAAAYEKSKNKTYEYLYYDTNCLVELDEEPPHEINKEALQIGLQIAILLNAKPFPVTQIMRKTVIDGSNTSGFQRTVLIAHDGYIETSQGKVGIETIALEEDAARIVKREKNKTTYNLDRLGIPLVEITTKPDLKSPEQIKEAALKIGEILRACKVKRGLGTIRQDLNISTEKTKRVEIKGFQDPKTMIAVVNNEAERQTKIQELKSKISQIKIPLEKDITPILKNTKCKFVKKAIENKEIVLGLKLENANKILGTEIQKGKRIGSDLSDFAKSKTGIGGIIHSDENLEKYDFSQTEIIDIKKTLELDEKDAFILIVAPRLKAEKSANAINARLEILSKGSPQEVRKANPEGTTTFLRPMPSAARMYPETDLPLLKISRDLINKTKNNLPKLISEHRSYLKEFGLNPELVKLLVKEKLIEEFDYLLKTYNNPQLVAKMLTIFLKEIENKENKKLEAHQLEQILEAVKENKISENYVKSVMQQLAQGKSFEKAIEKSEINLEKEVKELIKEKPGLTKGAYMGLIMSKHRGEVSGKEVSEELSRQLS